MAQRESVEEALQRWDDLEALAEHYADFKLFLHDVQLDVYGWETTEVQYDIADFLQYGGQNIMIQAQRGQAKTTITAIFAVWSLIQDPTFRILIVSAGSKKANEIAKGIILIINAMEELTCLRPDRNAGDRTSTEAFDVHYTLRGDGMNPSVACLGITSNLAGFRADILIPDDVESTKNALTQIQRENLLHLTKDFTSICSEGRILYLGTPQSIDSIYNSLPSRGYKVRVWTGRFPTLEEEKEYGDTLAPYLTNILKEHPEYRTGGGILGDKGIPIDTRLHEELLQKKELDQGLAYFKLQHMLCTKLSDTERFPLKLRDLVFMHLGDTEAPGKVSWQPRNDNLIPNYPGSNLQEEMFRAGFISEDMYPYGTKMMYIDPAGGGKNGDETVAVVVGFLHGYIFVLDIQGFVGGLREDVYQGLSALSWKYQCNLIQVEQNFGYGALAAAWRPVLDEYYVNASEGSLNVGPLVEDVWESGQKELRIIDVLEPVMSRHHLIVNESLIQKDVESTSKYPLERRNTYQVFHQMSRITRDKHSLLHDDRADALAGAVRFFTNRLAQDANKELIKKRADNMLGFMADPFGRGTRNTAVLANAFNKFNVVR
jgi:hypothetical protein